MMQRSNGLLIYCRSIMRYTDVDLPLTHTDADRLDGVAPRVSIPGNNPIM